MGRPSGVGEWTGWGETPWGMDTKESHPWAAKLWGMDKMGSPWDGSLWDGDKRRSHPWMADPWGVGRMGPAGLGSLEWGWSPFGHDPADGWSRSTLRLFWKELRCPGHRW